MEQIFLAHRAELLGFLRSRNMGVAAEDLLQELWLRLPERAGDMRAPLAYLYQMANRLVIDLRRKQHQTSRRDLAWISAVRAGPVDVCEQPLPDRAIAARDAAKEVLAALEREGTRVARVFRRHRLDGLTQIEVARELGVSIGTVEGDMRRAGRVILRFRKIENEG